MKRNILTIIICGAVVAFLFVAFIFVAPMGLNSDFVKNRIYTYVSTETGGRVEYEKLDLSFFPRFGLTVYGASFQLPKRVVAQFNSVTISPQFGPLLLGNIKITDLALDSPETTITIPAGRSQNGPSPELNHEDVLANLAPLLAPFAEGGLTVIVRNGSVALDRGDLNVLRFEGLRLKGSVTLRDGKVALSLKELRVESPRLMVSGKISGDPKKKRSIVSLEGKEIDVGSIRKQVLSLAGDISGVADFFALLKEGEIPFVKLNSEGDSFKESFSLKNMGIEGRIEQGNLVLRGLGLDIKDLNGDLKISGGVLEGSGLNAKIGEKIVGNGAIKLDLLDNEGPFRLDVKATADLAHLFPVLEGILGKNTVTKEFAGIKKIKGSAEGRIILDGTVRSFKTDVDVSRFNLRAVYQPVPYPILIKSGKVHYDDSGVAVKNLTGTLGKSSFSGLHGGLKWKPEMYLSVLSGTLGIVVDEIYPWIVSAAGLKKELGDIREASGQLDLTNVKFEGALFRPESWLLQGEGALKAVRVITPLLPGPLLVSRGTLKADSSRLIFMNADVRVLDCQITSNVTLHGYKKGAPSLQADFTGNMGPEMVSWLSKNAGLPEKLRMKAPLKFSHSRIKWEKNGLTVGSDIVSPEGVKVSFELTKTKDVFDLQKLVLSDGVSNGTFQLTEKRGLLDAAFSGSLYKETLDKLLVQNPILSGRIEGNLKARIPVKELKESKLSGNLRGWELDFSALKVPLKIEEVSLKTADRTVDVETMRFLWEEHQGNCKGQILFSEKDITVDLDVSMDELDWKNIETFLENSDAKKGSSGKKEKALPIQGVFRIDLGTFKYENLAWRPVHAEIRLYGDSVEIQFSENRICGIEVSGQMKIVAGEMWLYFTLLAENQPMKPTMQCLTNEEIDGTFSLKGKVAGKGKPEDFLKGMKGSLKFRAKDGTVNRSSMWTNIFQFLSLSNLLTGGFTHFKKDGFHFSDAKADVVLEGSLIQFKEGAIYGDSMDIAFEGKHNLLTGQLDLTLLIAPFTTANWIVRHIPIVNYLLAGTIGTIPVKVTGNIEDPKVTALSPSAVGLGLFGVLERTVTAPFTAVEALSSDKRKKGPP